MRTVSTLAGQQICYFSIVPSSTDELSPTFDDTHSQTALPLLTSTPSSPFEAPHPLIASATSPLRTAPTALTALPPPSLMQRQTTASLRAPSRPRIQDVLHVTSGDSALSSSTIDSVSSLDMARCSRCQRTPSLDLQTGKSNMIQYGLNLWYCNRCAGMVGLPPR